MEAIVERRAGDHAVARVDGMEGDGGRGGTGPVQLTTERGDQIGGFRPEFGFLELLFGFEGLAAAFRACPGAEAGDLRGDEAKGGEAVQGGVHPTIHGDVYGASYIPGFLGVDRRESKHQQEQRPATQVARSTETITRLRTYLVLHSGSGRHQAAQPPHGGLDLADLGLKLGHGRCAQLAGFVGVLQETADGRPSQVGSAVRA